MSAPFARNEIEPLSLVPFNPELLDSAALAAGESTRRRAIIRFHEYGEVLQRMLNAIEPESYARPHQHRDPDKPEVFVALRGSVLLVRFDENGTPLEGIIVSAEGPVRGAEVPPTAWHSLISLQSGTVLFEAKEGPYDAATDKRFAPWAPPEEDHEAGLAFIARLRAYFEPYVPELSARDLIAAEEEDIC
ncbi:MAG: WbuC family cupin fold metalloprotein [Chloroflexi bacterium]|nr:WbuC family cupin fold metalloprotein [Chloroflexota bacterium]